MKAYFVRVDVYVFADNQGQAENIVLGHLEELVPEASEPIVVDSGEMEEE